MACSFFRIASRGFASTALTLSSFQDFSPRHEHCNKNIISAQKCSHMISNAKAQHLDYSSSSSSITQRRSANFQPTLWTNDYLQSMKDDHFMEEKFISRFEKLKDATKHLLRENKHIIHQLKLIDTLRQFGVAYHFEKEIKEAIGTINSSVNINFIKSDLFATSLFFRLVREYGYKVSQGVFDRFKNENGNFQLSLCNDIEGMLSLYETSYLVMEGEDTLEEASVFTIKHLKTIIKEQDIDPILKERVQHALEMPMHWRMLKLHTHWFIRMYEKEKNMNINLLEFAKLDFNMVQSTYKRELKQCSRWWADLGLVDKDLSFSRDRLVENYLYAMGFASEPKLSFYRMILTQVHCLITTIDDIFDVYGTLDELELFTAAVDRWDANDIDHLPKYMKICFLGLFNSTNETAYKVLKMKNVNCIPYLKKSWVELCKAYIVEAKWAHNDYTPKIKEYLENAWISIGAAPGIVYSFFCTSETISNEALENLENYPTIMRQSCLILRLFNDLGTSIEEVKRGDVKKFIQCYMHENGVSEMIARECLQDLIQETWKELNTSRFTINSPYELSFTNLAIDIARMSHYFFDYGDGFGKPNHENKDRFFSLMVEPISLG
ncbi:terpene synthase 10-like [Dioscorea cayenensis subsp. rotundata]|uniref:Terpene synthase 10-like n=1 Tax=Dioscorea cayennensis subsp. rotundata TaxID=55577 RepID=A0AB40AWH1_DIOCR|nr:terpene synthase 10-like [Dioscorea cayenensis subsp. rotundata]